MRTKMRLPVTLALLAGLCVAWGVLPASAGAPSYRATLTEGAWNGATELGEAKLRVTGDGTLAVKVKLEHGATADLSQLRIELNRPNDDYPVVAVVSLQTKKIGGRTWEGEIDASALEGPLAGQSLGRLLAAMRSGETRLAAGDLGATPSLGGSVELKD